VEALMEIPNTKVVEVHTHTDVAIRRATHFVQHCELLDVTTRDVLGECM
jgi:hypothetical protein